MARRRGEGPIGAPTQIVSGRIGYTPMAGRAPWASTQGHYRRGDNEQARHSSNRRNVPITLVPVRALPDFADPPFACPPDDGAPKT